MAGLPGAFRGSVPAKYSALFDMPSPSASRLASDRSFLLNPCAFSQISGIPSTSVSTRLGSFAEPGVGAAAAQLIGSLPNVRGLIRCNEEFDPSTPSAPEGQGARSV